MRPSYEILGQLQLEKFKLELPTVLDITQDSFTDTLNSIPRADLDRNMISRNQKIAFAAGLIFQTLVKVDIEKLESIIGQAKYFFEVLMTQTLYALDKTDIELYLNQVIRSKNIKLRESPKLGALYSIIENCQIYDFLWQFSDDVKHDFIQHQDQQITKCKFFIHTLDRDMPAIVFLPRTQEQYHTLVKRNQKKFLLNALSTMLIECRLAASTRKFTRAVSLQPFRATEGEFWDAMLTKTQFNQERYIDLLNDEQFMNYVRTYFIVQNRTFDEIRNQMRQQVQEDQAGLQQDLSFLRPSQFNHIIRYL